VAEDVRGVSEVRRPQAVYFPGDEVRMRLTFRHEANIVAVEVVYAAQEDPPTR
jgi:hypothetical protein